MHKFFAEACAILHALCWSREHQQLCHYSCLLLLPDSCSVRTTLPSPPSFLLSQSLWKTRQELSSLSSCSIRLQWVPGHLFSRRTTRLMGLPNGERNSCPLRSLVVSLLLSLVSTFVFSRTGGVLSDQNSSTHRLPRFPPRNLYSFVMLAVFSFLYAATDTAYCEALISLGLAESRILPAAPANTRPRTLFISFCTVQLRTVCTACSLATLCLSTTSDSASGELPSF